MPRRKRSAEHVNDHQVELVKALAEEGRIVPAYESEDLPSAITEAIERQRLEGGGLRRMRLEVGGERLGNRMLGLVERAIEEMVRR